MRDKQRLLDMIGKIQDTADDTLQRFGLLSNDADKLMLAALTLRFIADMEIPPAGLMEISFTRERLVN